MKHIIVGTAGHVDHGKTTLIKALTGVDTDRLKAEKERGISIELGFASLNLDGLQIGLVDVPGHEKFIKNMLAGAAGLDLVLLVIAADEGIMPQTKEHLDILRFLQVQKGLVVLTKVDLVEDDWLEMVQEEVQEFLQGTFLAEAPIIPVSAATGQGLAELKRFLKELTAETEERSAVGAMRLPIDRVFSITGFGTVVTGTLSSGTVKPGDILEVLPEGLSSRVRSVQVHNQKVEEATAGQRTAINLVDLEVSQIQRGSVLGSLGAFQAVKRMDVKLTLLSEVGELKKRTRVRIHAGTAEVLGRVLWLGSETAKGGETTYAQLVLEEPLIVAKGDRLVLRSYSPVQTIGGGQVLEPYALKHKASETDLLEKLETLEKGTPEELVRQFLQKQADLLPLAEIKLDLTPAEIQLALEALLDKGQIKLIDAQYYLAEEVEQKWREQIQQMLKDYLQQFPLREGCPREEVRRKICPLVAQKKFSKLIQLWETQGILQITEKALTLPNYQLDPQVDLGQKAEQILALFRKAQCQPPSFANVAQTAGLPKELEAEMLHYLLRIQGLIKVGTELYWSVEALAEAEAKIRGLLQAQGQFTVSEARELLQTSRKYLVPLLEYWDRQKITRRQEDLRVAYGN